MTALLQFDRVENDKVEALSFSINAGEMRILEVHTQEVKSSVIDMALGELLPNNGVILLHGQPLDTAQQGSIAWIPANGGLISNLKVWENITLPLWYHSKRQIVDTEKSIAYWLSALNLEEQDWEKFTASPVARLVPWERKLAGLLRGLILAPQILIIDAALFDEIDASRTEAWINALEKFTREVNGRAVLVVANAATLLPWKIIQHEITG